MMFKWLKLIHKDQRGITLLELVIAIGLSGIIAGGATAAIFQVFSGNTRSNNHMIAIRQVQSAGYWFSRDAQMAQTVQLSEEGEENPVGTKFPLALTWKDWDGNRYEVVYTLEAGGQPKKLQRQYLAYDVNENVTENLTAIVAQYIIPGLAKTHLDFADSVLSLKVTATIGDESESRVYEVIPRSKL
jgi:type II secretory pathway component PulJ